MASNFHPFCAGCLVPCTVDCDFLYSICEQWGLLAFLWSPLLHVSWYYLNRQCVSPQWQSLPSQQSVRMAKEMNSQEGMVPGRGNGGERSEIWFRFRFLCSSKNNIKVFDTLTVLVIWLYYLFLFSFSFFFIFVVCICQFSQGGWLFFLGYSCFQADTSPSLNSSEGCLILEKLYWSQSCKK